MLKRSSSLAILLVAWRSIASSASSRFMPEPLSGHPDQRAAALLDVDQNAGGPGVERVFGKLLDHEAGRSTTSPAAILLERMSGRIRMLDMGFTCQKESRLESRSTGKKANKSCWRGF